MGQFLTGTPGHFPAGVSIHMLNDFLSEMADVVLEHNGTLDKFIGDGLMAVFGAPVPGESDAVDAIHAAIGMRAATANHNRERMERGLPSLEIGIGVHTGEVVAGNIGSERRLEYTVVGNTVNLASRLEALNKDTHTDILVSDATFD